MTSKVLISLALIPSMLCAYVMLTTFFGAARAYLAISWLPLGYILMIWMFTAITDFQHLPNEYLRELAIMIGWASLVQAGFGVGLIIRALCRREGAVGISIATVLSALPFFLRIR